MEIVPKNAKNINKCNTLKTCTEGPPQGKINPVREKKKKVLEKGGRG